MTDAQSLVVDRDVRYRETRERDLRLDLYYEREPGDERPRRPAVVLLHGGAWREGSKGQLSRYALDLAAAGYVTVEPNYRRSGEATFPAALRDAKAAVRYVRRRADALGVDPDRIGAFGHSAGAHLAVLAAVTGDDPAIGSASDVPNDGGSDRSGGSDRGREVAADLGAVVGVSGVYDLASGPHEEESSETAVAFLGGSYDEVPARYRAASVPTHVDAEGAARVPPTLLSHGGADEVVPAEQSRRCHERLCEAGVDAELHVVADGDHTFLHSSAWVPETFPRYREFLDEYL